jgi:hypothetical protein
MDVQVLVTVVENLVQRAHSGPLADQRRIVANLRYILENLEQAHQRHQEQRPVSDEEWVRKLFLDSLNLLYLGLEELESGLLENDFDRLDSALEKVRQAAVSFEQVEQQSENLSETEDETF